MLKQVLIKKKQKKLKKIRSCRRKSRTQVINLNNFIKLITQNLMDLSFTGKKNIRKNFGKLKESLSIPNLIEVQKNSYKQLTEFNSEIEAHCKRF